MLFKFRWYHPQAKLVEAAVALGITSANARMVWTRITRRPDFSVLCPECYGPERYNGGCHRCGVEFDGRPEPQKDFETQTPVHSILEGRGLGGGLSYADLREIARLAVTEKGKDRTEAINVLAGVLARETRPKGDALERGVLSDLLQSLKEVCPPDYISDDAANMARYEIKEFHAKHPDLNPQGLRQSIVKNVLKRLELTYPQLKGRLRQTLPPASSLRRKATRKRNSATSLNPLDPRFDYPDEDQGKTILSGDNRA